MNKKIVIVIIASLVIAALVIALTSSIRNNQTSMEHKLILTLFVPLLQKEVDNFYDEYLSSKPSVVNYYGNIICIKENVKGFYVKFGIMPYIGAHNPVGYDEVEYFVDNIGTITLLKFSHKKNYDIPPDEYIKAPIPTS